MIWFDVQVNNNIIQNNEKINMRLIFGTRIAGKHYKVNMRFITFILFVLFSISLAHGEVFKWVDEKGQVHFTDDITTIPEKYRRAIEEVEVREGKEESKKESEPLEKKQRDDYKDRLGRGEEYWKGRVEEWRKKLQSLQERVESLRLKYNDLTEKFNTSKSSVERSTIRNEREQIKEQMDQLRVQIGEAKEMLEKKIPEEAALYRAKPDWIRP